MKQLAGYFVESEESITTSKFLVFNQENEQLSVVTLEELKELHKNGLITETVKNDKGSIYEIAYQKKFWKVVEENTTGSISLDDMCEFVLPAILESVLDKNKECDILELSILNCDNINYDENAEEIRYLYLRVLVFGRDNTITIRHGVSIGENILCHLDEGMVVSSENPQINGVSYFNHSSVVNPATGVTILDNRFMLVTSEYNGSSLEVQNGVELLDIEGCFLDELILPESLHYFALTGCCIAKNVVIPKNIGIGLNSLLLSILNNVSNHDFDNSYSEKDNTQAMVNLLKNEYEVTVEIKE